MPRQARLDARKILSQVAIVRIKYSGAQVARDLGVTASAVNRMAQYAETPEVDRVLRMLRR